MATKICVTCKTEKLLESFSKHKLTKDGRQSRCKQCVSEYYRTQEGLCTKIYYNQKRNTLKKHFEPMQYSKIELFYWIINQSNFEELYDGWVKSDYNRNYAPSVDRINDYMGYSFHNITLTTWAENKEKGHLDRKYGINNKVNIAVIQLDKKTNKILHKYNSLSEANRATHIDYCCISKVCRGILKSAGGYKWQFV